MEYRTTEVQTFIKLYLHRAVDPAGLKGWLNFLAGGGTIQQAAAGVIGSAEYFQLGGARMKRF